MNTDTLFTIVAFDKKAEAKTNKQRHFNRSRRRETKSTSNQRVSSFEALLRQEFKAKQVEKLEKSKQPVSLEKKTLNALKRYWG